MAEYNADQTAQPITTKKKRAGLMTGRRAGEPSDDEYYTPRRLWEVISSFVPNTITTERGYPRKVVVGHFFKPTEVTELCTSPVDVATEFSCDAVPAADEWVGFFEAGFRALGVGVVIDNPPFSCIVKVLRKLFDSGIPFVLATSQFNFQQVGVRGIFHNDPNYRVVTADKSVTFKAGTEGKTDIAFFTNAAHLRYSMDNTTVDDYGRIWPIEGVCSAAVLRRRNAAVLQYLSSRPWDTRCPCTC
jgi:hypothetical protein